MVVGAVDFNKILERNSYACKKAFSRLFMTGKGRYAYADDWNVLADCIENMFNTIDEKYRVWGDFATKSPWVIRGQKMFERIRKLYMETFECRKMFIDYKRLSWGDTVSPEHTNVLIDVAKCLDDAMERSPRRGEVVLVDPDDWGTASSFIDDGTIVFVNFGTQAMSPAEVQYYLDNYNVVFAILIGDRLGNTGAFYKVFYTEPRVGSRVYRDRNFRLRRGAFYDNFGVYSCNAPWGEGVLPAGDAGILGIYPDYMVSAMYKIPTAVRWTWQYGVETEYKRIHIAGLDIPPNTCVTIHVAGSGIPPGPCNASAVLDPKFKEQLEIEFENRPSIGADILYSWAYARIGRGAVIELPLHGIRASTQSLEYEFNYILDWYIGAIAHVLLGEPDKCYIGPTPLKLRRVVSMLNFFAPVTNAIIDHWGRRSGWRVIDMRSRKS